MRQLTITKSFTSREQSVDKYLQEIGKYDLIDQDKEVELSEKIKKGDKTAMAQLTRANLRFVVSVAKQYQNQGLSLPDLINEGNLGLIKAAERFDHTRGFKFISFAVWWIRQSILQALAETARTVRLPLNQVSNISKINKFIARFEQLHNRIPGISEIAQELELPEDKVISALNASAKPVSFDKPLVDGEENSLLDLLANNTTPDPDTVSINESLKSDVARTLQILTKREEEIVKRYYGIGYPEMTLEEIGDVFALTRERVRQIKEKAIRRLRHSSRSKLLKEYEYRK